MTQAEWKAHNAVRDIPIDFTEADLEAADCLFAPDETVEDPNDRVASGAVMLGVRFRGAGFEHNTAIRTVRQCLPEAFLDTLAAVTQEKSGKEYHTYANSDFYYTVQSFWFAKNLRRNAKRTETCQRIRGLMWDIDNHTQSYNGATPEMIVNCCTRLMKTGKLPRLIIIVTGRGVQLHLPVIPCNPNNMDVIAAYDSIWEHVYSILEMETSHLEGVKIDRVRDLARFARVPGTYNTAARCFCHAVPGHAKALRWDIRDIAVALGVPSTYDEVRLSETEIYMRKLAKATKIFMSLSEHNSKAGKKTRFFSFLELAERKHWGPGWRHNVLLAIGSTLLDSRMQVGNACVKVDRDKLDMINNTFDPPLQKKDVDNIEKWLNEHKRAFKNDTIFRMTDIAGLDNTESGHQPQPPVRFIPTALSPIEAVQQSVYEAEDEDEKEDASVSNPPSSQETEGATTSPAPAKKSRTNRKKPAGSRYSYKEISWAVGFLVDNGFIPDTRRKDVAKNKKRKAIKEKHALERQERHAKKEKKEAERKAKAQAAKDAEEERAWQLLNSGLSEREAALEMGISKTKLHGLKMNRLQQTRG